ncbi:hypothetical protein KA025_01305 [Candidatus Saccharibacteria bacterium]|jgi:hypothetical protein|nr:hypothetical protein [Candidatus Saccharibacteria bacterium]MBP7834704.1 hypothetical protein [Candidatus Saccharibacteria bacterium]
MYDGKHCREKHEDCLNKQIAPGRLDGIVKDFHIYENTYEDAQETVLRYLDKINRE